MKTGVGATLLSDFKTPGRQPRVANDGGSAGRRVVRSALELLAEAASPEFAKGRASTQAGASVPAKFTVVRAAAPPPSPPNAALRPEQQEEEHWRGASILPSCSGGLAAMTTIAAEEPSTLLFLSPQSTVIEGEGVVKKRLFKRKKKTAKLSDSAKKTVQKEFYHFNGDADKNEKRVGAEEGVKERRDEEEVGVVVAQKSNSPNNQNGLLSRSEPLFTEEEVQQRIKEMLKAYEARRDMEEESVLQEVGHEIELQNVRYEKLLEEKRIVENEHAGLKARIEQLGRHCEALQITIAGLHNELQEEREKVSRLEVELCHARDEKRLASSGMQQELDFEKAQWKLAQEEMQRQINEFEEQLKTRTLEWNQLLDDTREKERERVVLSEQLAICQAELKEWQRRHREMELTSAEHRETVAVKEALVQQLQHKLQEMGRALSRGAASARDEQAELESRLRSIEEALQQQTDEVRRKMHRIHALEAEQRKAVEAKKTLRRTVREASNCFVDIYSKLETLIESFRTTYRTRCFLRSKFRDALFPAMASEEHCDVHELPANGNDSLYDMGEQAEEEDDSFLELVTCKELRDDLRASCLIPKKKEPLLLQRRRFNADQLRGDKHLAECKKSAAADTDNMYEVKRLQLLNQRCKRFLETLQQLFFGRQKELQRRAQCAELKQGEQDKAEMVRCKEALAACQASLEESRQQEKVLGDECRRRSDEVQLLERKLAEVRASKQKVLEQQSTLEERVEELLRERGILRLQLEASQQDCVGLRERYESLSSEAEEVKGRLNVLVKNHQAQEDVMEARSKIQVKLVRCTEKIKKLEEECKTLSNENALLSNKVKSMLVQLQTYRMRQSAKSSTQPVQKHMEQKPQLEELATLSKELGALRRLQESTAANFSKERANAELALKELRERNEVLREELDEGRRALNDVRNEMDMQKRAEKTLLRAVLGIYGSGVEALTTINSLSEGDCGGVQRHLFDSSLSPRRLESCASAGLNETKTAELRELVVSLAQRSVLEIARLKEALSLAQRREVDDRLGNFLAAEKLAMEAAQRSATRRQLDVENGMTPRQHHQPPQMSVCCSLPRKSPSPRQGSGNGEGIPHAFCRRTLSSGKFDAAKSVTEQQRVVARNRDSSSLRPSTVGLTRSSSTQGVLDGSCSPARPPVLWAHAAN